MKCDPGKAFPHPVLRPQSTDYPDAEFQVEIDLTRIEGSTALRVTAEFDLSDSDLIALIEAKRAKYVLMVKCSATHQRRAYQTTEMGIEQDIQAGVLSGRVELTPFVIAVQDVPAFQADGWHSDWKQAGPISLHPGTVLALDWPKEYYVDNAEEADIGSFLVVQPSDEVADGAWRCLLNDKLVQILMSAEDYRRFCELRANPPSSAATASLWNGVYLPALLQAINVADADKGALDEYGWYRSLDHQLKLKGLDALTDPKDDRLSDAQALLKNPFARIAGLANGGTT